MINQIADTIKFESGWSW